MNKIVPANAEAIVFDLGEVIIDLDPKAVIEGFLRVRPDLNPDSIRNTIVNSEELYLFETGQLEEEEFAAALAHHFSTELPVDDFRNIWNMMLLPVKKEKIDLLRGLAEKYRLFFLSNTNITHQRGFDQMASSYHGLAQLDELVEAAFYSHEVKMRKPELRIYEYLLKHTGSRPSQTIFIDDRIENVEAAARVGMNSFHLKRPSDLFQLFDLNND